MQKIKKLRFKEVRQLINESASMFKDKTAYYEKVNGNIVGHSFDDINPLKNLTGVKDVMPSYSADLLVRSGERNNVVKVHALPKSYDSNSKSINQVKLVKGRLPKQQGECVVESN